MLENKYFTISHWQKDSLPLDLIDIIDTKADPTQISGIGVPPKSIDQQKLKIQSKLKLGFFDNTPQNSSSFEEGLYKDLLLPDQNPAAIIKKIDEGKLRNNCDKWLAMEDYACYGPRIMQTRRDFEDEESL